MNYKLLVIVLINIFFFYSSTIHSGELNFGNDLTNNDMKNMIQHGLKLNEQTNDFNTDQYAYPWLYNFNRNNLNTYKSFTIPDTLNNNDRNKVIKLLTQLNDLCPTCSTGGNVGGGGVVTGGNTGTPNDSNAFSQLWGSNGNIECDNYQEIGKVSIEKNRYDDLLKSEAFYKFVNKKYQLPNDQEKSFIVLMLSINDDQKD